MFSVILHYHVTINDEEKKEEAPKEEHKEETEEPKIDDEKAKEEEARQHAERDKKKRDEAKKELLTWVNKVIEPEGVQVANFNSRQKIIYFFN